MVLWVPPATWLAGPVPRWRLASALENDVLRLYRADEASMRASIDVGEELAQEPGDSSELVWSRSLWNFGGMRDEEADDQADFEAPLAGLYEIILTAEWGTQAGSSGIRECFLRINDSRQNLPRSRVEPTSGGETSIHTLYQQVVLAAGDRVTAWGYQDNGSDLAIRLNGGLTGTRFEISYLGTVDSPVPAWTPPTTWANGNVPTAADFNAQIRDNLINLHNQNGYCAIVRKSTAQTISNATETILTWDRDILNLGGMHSTSVNNTRLTVPLAGWWQVWACVRWDSDPDGNRRHFLRLNGTATEYEISTVRRISDTRNLYASMYYELALAAGDYLEFGVEHSAGSALDVQSRPTRWGLRLVGD